MKLKPLSIILSALMAAPSIAGNLPEGPMAFEPISGSITGLSDAWKLPAGYTQTIISDEHDLDIYPGSSDWVDMNTVNEGPDHEHTGRYLYRTHEVRPDADNLSAFTGGAVSVVDLKSGKAHLLVQRADWEAIDGIVWTPWNTLLVGEETSRALLADPDVPQARHGLVYEIELQRGNSAKAKSVKVQPMIGSMAHEGIELDGDGNVYVVDEYSDGSIYRFVPDTYGDLSSGDLYALKVLDEEQTGPAEWVLLDRNAVQVSARDAAAAAEATTFYRPEDLERIGNTLYVAVTSENRVLAISLGESPVVSEFVNRDMVDTVTAASFKRVDNLASGPDGRLWIVEDNKPSDIWVADPDSDQDGRADRLRLFASFNDGRAEGTGIYFGKDPHTLFVNVQHSADGNDRTIAIRQAVRGGDQRGKGQPRD